MNQTSKTIEGFSRLSQQEKEELLIDLFELNPENKSLLASFRHHDNKTQKRIESFSENTLSNFHLPFGIAPNFLINGRFYAVPMVIEESSVVAAAANAAKFIARKGGFKTRVTGTLKTGQVHFLWKGNKQWLQENWPDLKHFVSRRLAPDTGSMEKRGGGVKAITLTDKTDIIEGYFQADVSFETVDAMGANFINTCLENIAEGISIFIRENYRDSSTDKPEVIMSILSNYTPGCIAEATFSCPIKQLEDAPGELSARVFAEKFKMATEITLHDVYRAVTHNKGIMNGIDAVVIASGNDFRAVEANAHAYAAEGGRYKGLTRCLIENDLFTVQLKIPLALGTIGGLTSVHPLARFSLELLGNPSANELMQIVAAAGLASNFAALTALITSGIQKGHMKMHLSNIIKSLNADEEEEKKIRENFRNKSVSVSLVRSYLEKLRKV